MRLKKDMQQVRTGAQQQQEFVPPYPSTILETGMKEGFLEELILKDIYMVNFALGREIASRTMLPFKIIEEILEVLKKQLLIEVKSSGGLADYEYSPTERVATELVLISTTTLTSVPALCHGVAILTL